MAANLGWAEGSSFCIVVVREQKQRARLIQDNTWGYRVGRQIRRFGLQTGRSARVECRPSNSTIWGADRQDNYWECRPSNSTNWSADRRIQRFRVQTVQFNDWECRPSNSTIWSANRQIRRFRLQTVRCAHVECTPSNSMIWNADR